MFAALIPALLASSVNAELTPDEVQQAVSQFTAANLTNIVPINNIVGLIQGNWGNVDFSKAGYAFTKNEANAFPDKLVINPAPGKKADNVAYSALLVDVGRAGQADTPKLHWLINNIHLNDTDKAGGPYVLNYSDGTTVKQYAAPAPQDQGAHRYVFSVFNQGANFKPPADYATADQVANVQDFDLQKYIQESQIGDVVAANYFTVDANAQSGNSTTVAGAGAAGTTGGANGTTAGGAGGNSTAEGGAAGANGTTAGGAGGNSTEGGAAGSSGNSTEGGAAGSSGNSTAGGAAGSSGNSTEGGAAGGAAGSSGASGSSGAAGASGTSSGSAGASSSSAAASGDKKSGASTTAPAVGIALAAAAVVATLF